MKLDATDKTTCWKVDRVPEGVTHALVNTTTRWHTYWTTRDKTYWITTAEVDEFMKSQS